MRSPRPRHGGERRERARSPEAASRAGVGKLSRGKALMDDARSQSGCWGTRRGESAGGRHSPELCQAIRASRQQQREGFVGCWRAHGGLHWLLSSRWRYTTAASRRYCSTIPCRYPDSIESLICQSGAGSPGWFDCFACTCHEARHRRDGTPTLFDHRAVWWAMRRSGPRP